MTPEEFERIKEAEKAHLRKLKELKQAVHQAERKKRISETLSNMAGGARDTLDENEALIEKLSFEAARHEARFDVAMEGSPEKPTAGAPNTEVQEEALRQARARQLVEDMRRQVQVEQPTPENAPVADSKAPSLPPPTGGLPEKTIGRMK